MFTHVCVCVLRACVCVCTHMLDDVRAGEHVPAAYVQPRAPRRTAAHQHRAAVHRLCTHTRYSWGKLSYEKYDGEDMTVILQLLNHLK